MEERIIFKRELENMPYDRHFSTEIGTMSVHATGYEVLIDGEWWDEYLDPFGEYHYAR